VGTSGRDIPRPRCQQLRGDLLPATLVPLWYHSPPPRLLSVVGNPLFTSCQLPLLDTDMYGARGFLISTGIQHGFKADQVVMSTSSAATVPHDRYVLLAV
jgi:hypothetical protein